MLTEAFIDWLMYWSSVLRLIAPSIVSIIVSIVAEKISEFVVRLASSSGLGGEFRRHEIQLSPATKSFGGNFSKLTVLLTGKQKVKFVSSSRWDVGDGEIV